MTTETLKSAIADYETASANAAQAREALTEWTAAATVAMAKIQTASKDLAEAPIIPIAAAAAPAAEPLKVADEEDHL